MAQRALSGERMKIADPNGQGNAGHGVPLVASVRFGHDEVPGIGLSWGQIPSGA